ncbi:hypothetical protein TNCV_3405061 [Trichonephila clavipes]|nr:hypothetical protein TNCV_3405061 [Trichonephila clavipes]
MWTTPELIPPFLTTTPHQREDVSTLDRFNVHRCPTRWVFSGTGQATRSDTYTTHLPWPNFQSAWSVFNAEECDRLANPLKPSSKPRSPAYWFATANPIAMKYISSMKIELYAISSSRLSDIRLRIPRNPDVRRTFRRFRR